MRTLVFALGLGITIVGVGRGQESSAQRLDAARRNTEEASWPKKPDQRISSLSGKMKEVATISPRFYGQGREYAARRLDHLQKEASLVRQPAWNQADGRGQEQVRWSEGARIAEEGHRLSGFQPGADRGLASRRMAWTEIGTKPAPGWSSREAPVARDPSGTVRMYEGRLTRVREQVVRQEEKARDLGPGRQEKFRPEEVEKILSEPVGEFRSAATEQSPSASPLAAADN